MFEYANRSSTLERCEHQIPAKLFRHSKTTTTSNNVSLISRIIFWKTYTCLIIIHFLPRSSTKNIKTIYTTCIWSVLASENKRRSSVKIKYWVILGPFLPAFIAFHMNPHWLSPQWCGTNNPYNNKYVGE